MMQHLVKLLSDSLAACAMNVTVTAQHYTRLTQGVYLLARGIF